MMTATQRTMTFVDRGSAIGEFNRRDNDVIGSRMMDRKMKIKENRGIVDKEKRCDERDNEICIGARMCMCICTPIDRSHRSGRVNEMEKVGAERVQISGNEIERASLETVCFARGRREQARTLNE